MNILSKNTKAKTRKIKNKKGTIWNLEKVAPNHIEIKAIGGEDYHKYMDKIIEEFDMYVQCFDDILNGINSEYKKNLIDEHKRLVDSSSKIMIEEFSKAIDEAGLIDSSPY